MPQTIDRDEAYTIAAYLRVASVAIALYDFLETFPTSWRFYAQQYRSRRISISGVLFALIQTISIVTLVISNVGFFYEHFTDETCQRFYLVPPSFKVLQAMVSEAILAVRAWNLSRRSRQMGYGLLAMYTFACALQWVTTLYNRKPMPGTIHRNCRAFNSNSGHQLGAWTNYAVAVIYDFAMTAISIFYLFKYKRTSNSSMMSKLTKMMLYDGIGYFVALAAVNLANVFLFKSQLEIQTAGASLGYCVSWIMSQRLLIHLYDASVERRNESINEAVTITRNVESARDISHAVRTQFEQKTSNHHDLSVPEFSFDTEFEQAEVPEVEVRIERTVKLDRRLRTFELENYSRSGRYDLGRV